MEADRRTQFAKYYDLWPLDSGDILFYKEQAHTGLKSVLELGCGTGRVLVQLAESFTRLHGVDYSSSMLQVCRQKFPDKGAAELQVKLTHANACTVRIPERFDLIIAPFHLVQIILEDEKLDQFMETIKAHLSPNGRCILNIGRMTSQQEHFSDPNRRRLLWKKLTENNETVRCYATAHAPPRKIGSATILFPRLVCQRFSDTEICDEAELDTEMRLFTITEFQNLIESHGFQITDSYGGYRGEPLTDVSAEVVFCFCFLHSKV